MKPQRKFPDHIYATIDDDGKMTFHESPNPAQIHGQIQAEYVLDRVQRLKITRQLEDVEL